LLERFGEQWHLSAEQSLWRHGEKTIIPKRVVACSPKGTNRSIELIFGTSIYDLKVTAMSPREKLMTRDDLRLFSPPASQIAVVESSFARNPVEMQAVLASLTDISDLLRLLLRGGHSAKAVYIAGALREIGRPKQANEVLGAMRSAGYDVREKNSSMQRKKNATAHGI
jgi:hypothetical protein